MQQVKCPWSRRPVPGLRCCCWLRPWLPGCRRRPAQAEKIKNQIAVFAALDKVTGRISHLEIPIDQTVEFGALKVTPRVCNTRPPTEAPDTASFVEVDEIKLTGEEQRIFTGWMFAESPGLHAVEHPVFDVWLTNCKTAPRLRLPIATRTQRFARRARSNRARRQKQAPACAPPKRRLRLSRPRRLGKHDARFRGPPRPGNAGLKQPLKFRPARPRSRRSGRDAR